jgi:hypothetical protein
VDGSRQDRTVHQVSSQPARFAPLTPFERDQIARAVAAIRGGDRRLVRSTLRDLSAWSSRRVLAALATLCARYLQSLASSEVISLGGDGEELETLLAELALEIPEALRPTSDILFRALTVALVPSSPAAQQFLDEDGEQVFVGLLQLAAALLAAGQRNPQARLSSPVAALADVVAPD